MDKNTARARPASLPALTGFRFIAAMMVVLSHFKVPGIDGTAFMMTMSGYAGVTFFFVLSGFVLAYNYLDGFQHELSARCVRDYFVARFARVYPLYLFCLLPGWLATPNSDIWMHLLTLQAWHPDIEVAFGYNGPAWSVSVEAFLYVMFPILIPLLSSLGVFASPRRLAWAAFVIVSLLLLLALNFTLSGQSLLSATNPESAHRWLYRTPLSRLGDFVLGILGAAYVMRFATEKPAELLWWRGIAACAVVAVLVMAGNGTFHRSAFSWDVGYAVPAVLLFMALAIDRHTSISRALGSPAMLLLGEASYALYLVHAIPGRVQPIQTGDVLTDLALYGIFMVLLITLAIGLHVGLERPARQLIRTWLSSRSRDMASPSPIASSRTQI